MKMVLIKTCSSLSNLFCQIVAISMYIQVNFPTVYMIIILSLSVSSVSSLSSLSSVSISLSLSLSKYFLDRPLFENFYYLGIY